MKISVIIPTYKPQGYLWECLDSLAAQTFSSKDFETIIVLNGCKDPYLSDIQKYMEAHADMDIKLIQTDKGGVSNARNIGLDNAAGRFIAFIDDDDKVSPSYLQEMYDKADEETIVLSNTYNYFEEKPSTLLPIRCTELHAQLSPAGKTDLNRSRRFFFTVWMKLIPAAIIGNRRFDTDFKIGEDSIFMFLISDKIKYTDFTSDKAVYYRRLRKGSAMNAFNDRKRQARNDLRMIWAYTKIYLSGLCRYSLHFYLTRVRGAIHI